MRTTLANGLIKNKCTDTVVDVLVEKKIILRFGMPLVIHSDQGREFENGLGCTKTQTSPYHPELDCIIERFNRTCLMMLSMFVNDQCDNWDELLPYVMHAYRTSVHESTGYSPFRLMMDEECSLPQDVSTSELRTNREHDKSPHPFATWVRDALEVAYDHVRESLHRTAARRKRVCGAKAVNRKFPIGSWALCYYPPAAQHTFGITMDRTQPSCSTGNRSYGWHIKGPGKANNICSCGRSETLPGPIGHFMESRPRDIKIIIRQYNGSPTGLSQK